MKGIGVVCVCLALAFGSGCDEELPVCDLTHECGTVTSQSCSGDWIEIHCSNGYECKQSCSEVCRLAGATYTGTCGRSAGTDRDVCFCS